jgi:hypothetical protein
VERLPFRFETADSVLLVAYFESFARELKARFREEMVGDWPPLEPLEPDPNAAPEDSPRAERGGESGRKT